jgi:sporulation protein YlmC with PRC-barrel domain
MKPDAPLKLLSEVRDLQIVDCEGRNCGICDDIELDGGPGSPLSIAALLIGPGAYARRFPHWTSRIITAIAGRRVVRVPWNCIEKISGRIYLSVTGEAVGLRKVEDRLEATFKRIPLS